MYALQVKLFLKGVVENVVLLLDDCETMYKQLVNQASKISSSRDKALQVLLEEILTKYRHKRFVTVESIEYRNHADDSSASVVILNEDCFSYDAIIGCHEGADKSRTIDMGEYEGSIFESNRKKYTQPYFLQSRSKNDVAALLNRVFRYSRNVTILDSQIGKANSPDSFLIGLKYVLQVLNNCKSSRDAFKVELITLLSQR